MTAFPDVGQPPALEAWYRQQLGGARFDISSSGVRCYTFGELRTLLNLTSRDLDAIALDDSVSYGAPELRQAIADRYAGGDASRVIATHGSSEAIALVLSALLAPGDRVVVVDPIYHAFRTYAELQRCEVVRLPVAALADDDRRSQTIRAAVTPTAKAVIVNFPHNPTGRTLSLDAFQFLVARVTEVGAILVWDAAMAELPMSAGSIPPRTPVPDEVVGIGTLSKAFGLPGLRVGWCIATPALLERMLPMRDRTTLFLSPLVELIATRAIQHADKLIAPRLEQARRNLDVVDGWVAQHRDVVTWRRPDGGVCGLLDVRGVSDTYALCRELAEQTGVLLVPGCAFDSPTAVRIGYGGDAADLKAGLRLLARFLRRRGVPERDHGAGRQDDLSNTK